MEVFHLQWNKWVHDICNKTKVLLCITFLEDFSSHLTDTLITLETDMQTQFWFKTLIVYTYSIIYSIISETFRVSICNHQFLQVFFCWINLHYPLRFGGHVWHSGTLWFAGGEFLRGKKQTHVMSDHMVDVFRLLWCEKNIILDAKPKDVAGWRGMFLMSTEVWSCLLAFFLEKIGNQQATSCLLQVVDVYGELGF